MSSRQLFFETGSWILDIFSSIFSLSDIKGSKDAHNRVFISFDNIETSPMKEFYPHNIPKIYSDNALYFVDNI